MNELISILSSTIASSAGIMFAAVGEVINERAGVLNLGLEGIMLMGASTAYVALCVSGNLFYASLVALGVGAMLGLIYAFLTITLRANQTVCGLAMVIFGSGTAALLGEDYAGVGTTIYFAKTPIPGLSQIPFIGPVLFNHTLPIYFLFVLVIMVTVYLYKTLPGLKLQALGENPAALDVAGNKVFLSRYIYLIIGCSIVAYGGAYITLAYTPSWYDGITSGQGWIAAALVKFASWNPAIAALGALLFGGISVLGLRLQAMGVNISTFFISMLPYICTALVLIFTSGKVGKKRSAAPASLTINYDREAR
jgi:ABC-type uncharacterized transport system permease subunit